MGLLTHVAGPGTPGQVYRETIELAVAAEELGFCSFWLAQHHSSPGDGLAPSPLVLLAAIAQHTSTIRLGTAVVAAPLEDPRRLAEDAAVLDAVSGGRLELGLGTGSDAAASAAFGRDHAQRHGDCAEVVDRLRALLTGDSIVPDGGDLPRRLWWATGSSGGVDAAAARGMGVITGRLPFAADSTVLEDLDRYWTRAVDEPRVAVSRLVALDQRPEQLVGDWALDPALDWATDLIVQVRPARAGFAAQLAMARTVAGEVAPALAARSRPPARPRCLVSA